MKTNYLILVMLCIITACTPEEPRRSALQANIDDIFYGALDIKAERNDDGSFVITGTNIDQSLRMNITSGTLGEYTLGGSSNNSARFRDFQGNTYFTNPLGGGTVTVLQNDTQAETISGEFEFTAVIPAIDTIRVSKGVFYKVPYGVDEFPIVDEEVEEPDPATNAGQFVARIDGEEFTPFAVSAVKSNNSIRITGTDADESISVTVPFNITPGSYLFDTFGVEGSYRRGANTELEIEGNMSIIVHDVSEKNMRATFAFITENHDITLGFFDVIYEEF